MSQQKQEGTISGLKERVKIDLTDRKILYELDLNGRASFSEIGKKIRLSKQAVKERIRKLEEKDVIKQYFALIDINKMGYTFYRLDIKFQNVSKKKEKEIIKYILNLPKVIWVAELHGKWDVAVIFLTKNLVETDDNIRNIKWKFNKYIQDYSFSIATTHTRYKYGFLLDKKSDEEVFMGRELGDLKLPKSERDVLSILARDGRKPLVEIANDINKSVGAAKNVIKRLKSKKVILGFSTLINLEILGYSHYKLFIDFQAPSEKKESELMAYFRRHPNIIFMTKSLGRYDIECESVTKSVYEFKEILSEMKHKFPELIKDIETYLVLNEHMTNYYPV